MKSGRPLMLSPHDWQTIAFRETGLLQDGQGTMSGMLMPSEGRYATVEANGHDHRVAAGDVDFSLRVQPPLRLTDLCTPDMGVNLWGVSPLCVNHIDSAVTVQRGRWKY